MMGWVYLTLGECEKIPGDWCLNNFPGRFMKAQRFVRQEDRLRCLGAGALLHGFLGIPENEICYGRYGKPFQPGGVRFSLSHSGDFVVLAYGDLSVGTDVEKMDESQLSLSERVTTFRESEWMSVSPRNRFFVLWTLKESIMKLYGLGLSLKPETVDVTDLAQKESMSFREKVLYSRSCDFQHHAFAICAEQPLSVRSPEPVSARDCLSGTKA